MQKANQNIQLDTMKAASAWTEAQQNKGISYRSGRGWQRDKGRSWRMIGEK